MEKIPHAPLTNDPPYQITVTALVPPRPEAEALVRSRIGERLSEYPERVGF